MHKNGLDESDTWSGRSAVTSLYSRMRIFRLIELVGNLNPNWRHVRLYYKDAKNAFLTAFILYRYPYLLTHYPLPTATMQRSCTRIRSFLRRVVCEVVVWRSHQDDHNSWRVVHLFFGVFIFSYFFRCFYYQFNGQYYHVKNVVKKKIKWHSCTLEIEAYQQRNKTM